MRLLHTSLLMLTACCALCNAQTEPGALVVPAGTRIPLVLMYPLNGKKAKAGDVVRFKTVFPVAVDNRMVIPAGSFVTGELSSVKRPGRVKGKGEIAIRFTKLQLPGHDERDFPATLSSLDPFNPGKKSKEGNVEAASGEEAKKVGRIAKDSVNEIILEDGAAAGPYAVAEGVVIGAGAAVLGSGLSLLTRGPDVNLPSGTQIEVRLIQEISFSPAELPIIH